MSWFAAESTERDGYSALVVVLLVLIVAGIIYTFGYARAVMHRANRDYKSTKAAVPKLRKGFWSAFWTVFKIGFGVLIAMGILIYWGVADTDEDRWQQPRPATVSSPAGR